MTHNEFKKLEFEERVQYLRDYNVYVSLWRCPDGGGEIEYEQDKVIECKNRESLNAQLEHIFLLKKEIK